MLLSGEEVGGFFELKIAPLLENENSNHLQYLKDKMTTAPYLDWSHKTEWLYQEDKQQFIQTRVLVKEENHLFDLVELIKEWGYECKISKK